MNTTPAAPATATSAGDVDETTQHTLSTENPGTVRSTADAVDLDEDYVDVDLDAIYDAAGARLDDAENPQDTDLDADLDDFGDDDEDLDDGVLEGASYATRDLGETDEDEQLHSAADVIAAATAGLEYDDYDFAAIVGDLNFTDIPGSLQILEAYRGPFVAAADRAKRKNPSAEFYNAANPPLFTRRIELRSIINALETLEELSVGDEIDLSRAKGEMEALTTLIVRLNYGMTRNYVKQFTSNTSLEDSADFQSAANLGLMVAIDSFDPSRGKFGSWAYKPIQRAVLKAVREADFKNLNEGDFEKRPKVLKAFRELIEERGEDAPTPTYDEVAERAGVHHALAKRVLAAPHLDSIHARVGDEGSSELGDLIPDTAAAFEESVISQIGIAALMEHGMTNLSPREHYVLVRVTGLDGEEPDALSDIGAQLGLSREAARQIRGKAFAKLLHPITLRKLVRGGRD